MSSNRLKVLLCCYACDPYQGSEPGTGWQFVRHISQYHDIHVIVETKFQKSIETYVELHPDELGHVRFHFIKRERRKLLRKIWPPSYYWYYLKWQKDAYEYAQQLHEREKFDLVHQITLVGYRVPGYLWKLKTPFVWGPIGGLNQTAWKLLPGMGVYGCIFYTFRNLINLYQRRWSKLAKEAAHHAHTIIASDPDYSGLIQRLWGKTPLIMREVGVSTPLASIGLSSHAVGTPLHVCWAGIHTPRKALNIIIQALPLCKQKIHLDVLGSGPCTPRWQKLAIKLKVDHLISFHGKIPHHQVFDIMSQSHAFCISSISEGGTPNIVMEALQQGLPIISLNHCAFASVVNDSCGIKIDIGSTRQIIKNFAVALDTLASDESHRCMLARGAIERSKQYTWKNKADILDCIYREATSNCRVEK